MGKLFRELVDFETGRATSVETQINQDLLVGVVLDGPVIEQLRSFVWDPETDPREAVYIWCTLDSE